MTQSKKQRVIKDLNFLRSLAKQQLAPNLIKRIEKAGDGQTLSDIKIPIDVYISYDKYDYQGKIITNISHLKAKMVYAHKSESFPPGLFTAMKSMKLNQVAWINARSYDMHLTQQFKDTGCHYRLQIDQIVHKNDDTFEAKKLVTQKNKQEGKQLFKNKQYYQAMKKYKAIINISQGYDRKKITKEQMKEIRAINLNAKENYLKCFSKMRRNQDEVILIAEGYLQQLINESGLSPQNLYLKANVQMHKRYLTDALQTAKLFYAEKQEQGERLIKKIKDRISKKAHYV